MRQRLLRRLGDKGVERPHRLDRFDMRRGQLARRELLGPQPVARLGEGQVGEVAHSTTFGTAKKPRALAARCQDRGVAIAAVGDHVVAHRQRHLGDAGHRRDTVGVDLISCSIQSRMPRELGGQRLELVLADANARQGGDARHGGLVQRHDFYVFRGKTRWHHAIIGHDPRQPRRRSWRRSRLARG